MCFAIFSDETIAVSVPFSSSCSLFVSAAVTMIEAMKSVADAIAKARFSLDEQHAPKMQENMQKAVHTTNVDDHRMMMM